MTSPDDTSIGEGFRNETYFIAVEPPLSLSELKELGRLGVLDPENVWVVGEEPGCSLFEVDGGEEMMELRAIDVMRFLTGNRETGEIHTYLSPVELSSPSDTPFN